MVDAVDDKLRFFIVEKSLWGGYADLINSYALDIQTLLSVVDNQIWEMRRAQDVVVHRISTERSKEKYGKADGKAN